MAGADRLVSSPFRFGLTEGVLILDSKKDLNKKESKTSNKGVDDMVKVNKYCYLKKVRGRKSKKRVCVPTYKRRKPKKKIVRWKW